jgi:hypothetical protein
LFSFSAPTTSATRSKRRQIDQEVGAARARFLTATDHHMLAILGIPVVGEPAMRQKTALREGPEQLVEPGAFGVGRGVDQNLKLLLDGFLREAAGQQQARLARRPIEDVKVDARHDT